MLLEDILLAIAVGVVLLTVGLPIYRLSKGARWRRRDPLAEAHERLRIAKLEAEAARVNREAERVYERLYEEALTDDRGNPGDRVVKDEEPTGSLDEQIEKGKRHGHE